MRQICSVCKILYGIKEPLKDESETHGLCPECFELEIEKIEAFKRAVWNVDIPGKLEGDRT